MRKRDVAPSGVSGGSGVLQVVAGENFWGSIVSQIGGTHVNVLSIVSDPNADPHEYETNASDARAFANANYVILNGAGYPGQPMIFLFQQAFTHLGNYTDDAQTVALRASLRAALADKGIALDYTILGDDATWADLENPQWPRHFGGDRFNDAKQPEVSKWIAKRPDGSA